MSGDPDWAWVLVATSGLPRHGALMALSWDELEQIRGRQEWRIPIPPTCPRCDYNLTGLPESRCPECGHVFNWGVVRRRAGRIWSAVNTLRHANRDAIVGLKAVGFGWAIMFPIVLLRLGWVSCFLRSLAAAAGLMGIVLGAQVLNVRRVPPWAREYVEGEPPNIWLGLPAVLLGLLLLALILVMDVFI